MAEAVHVPGQKKRHILLYALSTCGWCRKTKQLLNDMGIEYYYIDVDQLTGEERDHTVDAIREKNPKCSFPTIVIDGQICVVGFKEDELREALKE